MPVAPTANQFGMPASAPLRPLTPAPSSGNGRQLAVLGGIAAAVVLLVVGLIWLQGQGKKTATKVANTVETPIVKAHQTVEIMDLQQASQAEETYLADHSTYATSVTDLSGFTPSPGTKITVVSATATAYCLRADDVSTLPAPSMYVSSAVSGASTTPCI
jgi:cytoskeletal protein RodZ